MIASILATAVCALAAPVPSPAPAVTPHASSTAPDNDKALKALAAWLKQYQSGKINIYSTAYLNRALLQTDWREQKITAKQSFAVRYGLAPKSGLGESTWLNDLEVIAEEVAKTDTADAAELLVELAAVGLDQRQYAREQAPHMVRAQGEKWIGRLKGAEARAEVARIASGETKPDPRRAGALQGAALRGLAAFRDPAHRAVIEGQLAQDDALLRFHAADALARLGDVASAPALIGALERETSDVAMPAIVDALRAIYDHYLSRSPTGEAGEEAPAATAKTPPESSRLAVRAALLALGRTSWRGDMALLRLIDDLRSKESIPGLIGVLELYRDNPDQIRSGKLSTLVQHRAHELLVSMTGAVFPATEPEKWREMWEQEQDKIDIEQRHAAPTGNATTVASGFCGIPVEGSRVIFILDLSRSMTFAMDRKGGTNAGSPGGADRMDYARRELHAAIDTMGDLTSFNLITFDGNEEAETWSKKLLPATAKNRQKIKKYIDGLKPDGGTNLWSALEEALKTKSLVYGDRYETNVDEIFILSDGAPSVGEVLDPMEILRLVKEANRFAKMRINTIFITSDDPEDRRNPAPWMGKVKPEELMRRLAQENGGKCVIL